MAIFGDGNWFFRLETEQRKLQLIAKANRIKKYFTFEHIIWRIDFGHIGGWSKGKKKFHSESHLTNMQQCAIRFYFWSEVKNECNFLFIRFFFMLQSIYRMCWRDFRKILSSIDLFNNNKKTGNILCTHGK